MCTIIFSDPTLFGGAKRRRKIMGFGHAKYRELLENHPKCFRANTGKAKPSICPVNSKGVWGIGLDPLPPLQRGSRVRDARGAESGWLPGCEHGTRWGRRGAPTGSHRGSRGVVPNAEQIPGSAKYIGVQQHFTGIGFRGAPRGGTEVAGGARGGAHGVAPR